MRKNFFLKIFFSFISAAAGMAALIMFFSFASVRKHYIEVEAAKLTDYTTVMKAWIIPNPQKINAAGLQKLLSEAGKKTNTRFTVVDTSGVVLADSGENPAVMDNHASRPEVAAALTGKNGRATRYSHTIKQEMLYVAAPVTDGSGKVVLVIRTSMPLSGIKQLVNKLFSDILTAMFLILAASTLAALLLARGIYAPIKQLVDASKQVASGNFSSRVHVREKNEIRELADNFNSMTAEISALFGGLNEKKEQLDAIIASVAEGLIVVDEKGKIVLANKSFKNIAGNDCGEGHFYWECFLPPKFNETVDAGIKNRKNFTEQLEIKNKVYLCGGTYMENRNQSAFVLYDITEFKDLERIKKDFVANVSHELRTPLTAIKGFAETLEENTKDAEDRHYLDVIKKHTERLINIVSDLLTLSQLEQVQQLAEKETLDFRQMSANAAKIFEQQVKAKGLSLNVETESGLPAVKGDHFRLEQVMINLIDNAVKYTEKGSISLKIYGAGQNVKIEVSDTGIGIPQEHAARIFERFYVVDKSRSKKSGGTGLGLSIVKHIVLMHNGTISVDSRPGEGTKVTVTIPVK